MKNSNVTKQQLTEIIDNPATGVQKEYTIINEDKKIIDIAISRIREGAILGYDEIGDDVLEIHVKNDWSI